MDPALNMINEDILKIVKEQGPIQPSQLVNNLPQTNTTVVGAYLSKLIDENKIFYTHIKRGSSPYYYVQGQEKSIEKLSMHLNEKDQITRRLLKEKSILKESEQTPLVRVSLKNIPDYAKSVKVKINGEPHTYWRYYLTNEEEAVKLIRENLTKHKTPVKDPNPTTKSNTQSNAPENNNKEEKRSSKTQDNLAITPNETKSQNVENTPFLIQIKEYLQKKEVKINTITVIRKNFEYEIIANQKTNFGYSPCYIYAKKKSKINDGDISQAYLEAIIKQMPLIYISTGDITKKAQNSINSKYKNAMVRKIQ